MTASTDCPAGANRHITDISLHGSCAACGSNGDDE